MINKKYSERIILDYIYKGKNNLTILEREEPDFWLKYDNEMSYFGIEVTEFFLSQSSARIDKIPGYFKDIMDKGSYRHKDDKEILSVKDAILISHKNNEKKAIKVIPRESVNLRDVLLRISELINQKNSKLSNYNKSLSHINLIINDTESIFYLADIEQFYSLFFRFEIKKSILAANFRDIYFITSFKGNKKYIPLKLTYFVSRFYVFKEAVMKYNGTDKTRLYDFLRLFGSYLRQEGFVALSIISGDHIELIYGNTGLFIKNNQLNIKDYEDRIIPDSAVDICQYMEIPSELDNDLQQLASDIDKNGTLRAELAFDVCK